MNIVNTAKNLIRSKEIETASSDVLQDLLDVILSGNPISLAKIIIAIASSPFFIREHIFWAKFEAFLSGIDSTDDDRAKFCARLAQEGNREENALRLISCIERSETKQKAIYLANAGRALSAGYIDLPDFFRICHMIVNLVDEDLRFLAENIERHNLPYSASVQGLLSSGLMYQSVIDANGNQQYSFTPIAELVDKHAVSFDNIERYPDPTKQTAVFAPQLEIDTGLRFDPISESEIETLFEEA